jgi:hypothetical protein
VIVLYFVASAALLWPFVAHPRTTLMGPLGYDVSGSIATFNAIASEGTSPFTSGRLKTIGYPDGVPKRPAIHTASALSSSALWFGSAAFGAIPAHGLEALLGLFLTATVTFLFVRSVTGSTGAGFVSGVAYGYFPHMLGIARAAPTYTHMWLYVLPLWALTDVVLSPTRRRALLVGASVVPAMFWTPYYAEHVLVVAAACGVVAALLIRSRWGWRRLWPTLGWAGIPVTAAMLLYVILVVVGGATAETPERSSDDAYALSAHPLMFVLPGQVSAWREIGFGTDLYEFLVRTVPRAAQTDLYLGWSVLVLATIGLVWAVRHRRALSSPGPREHAAPVVAALLAAAGAVACFAVSGPPTVRFEGLGVSVPTPSWPIAHAARELRTGQRFVMPIMGCVAVLAGIATAALLARRGPAARVLIATALALIVGIDLRTRIEDQTHVVPQSKAMAALRAAVPAPAIQYLPEGLLAGRVTEPCVWQIQHHKTLVNPCDTTYFPPLIWELSDASDCRNLRRLESLGVRYVISERRSPVFAGCQGRRRAMHLLGQDEYFTIERLRLVRPRTSRLRARSGRESSASAGWKHPPAGSRLLAQKSALGRRRSGAAPEATVSRTRNVLTGNTATRAAE